MKVEEKESLIKPSSVLLNLTGSSFGECLNEFTSVVQTDKAVLKPEILFREVQEREQSSSTNTGRGVAFPHARTDAVKSLFVAVGRSMDGVKFEAASAPVHLFFLIGTPPEEIGSYLSCMSRLASRLRIPKVMESLMEAQTPEAFLAILQGES
ncbi:MAG: PTS sugar transporter subunit IIA [Chthoniobacterales bacterium]